MYKHCRHIHYSLCKNITICSLTIQYLSHLCDTTDIYALYTCSNVLSITSHATQSLVIPLMWKESIWGHCNTRQLPEGGALQNNHADRTKTTSMKPETKTFFPKISDLGSCSLQENLAVTTYGSQLPGVCISSSSRSLCRAEVFSC